jgi:hypothetical protein
MTKLLRRQRGRKRVNLCSRRMTVLITPLVTKHLCNSVIVGVNGRHQVAVVGLNELPEL